jgi:hypothetical protein
MRGSQQPVNFMLLRYYVHVRSIITNKRIWEYVSGRSPITMESTGNIGVGD